MWPDPSRDTFSLSGLPVGIYISEQPEAGEQLDINILWYVPYMARSKNTVVHVMSL